jgi:hypothetical protein
MNLLWPLPSPMLAYPDYQFSEVVPEQKPDVLVVGDSYYWNIFNTRIPAEMFTEEAFWYFNALVYPDHYYAPTRVEDIDIRKEIERRDFIFLMVTERFLYKFDWAFTDMLFDIYADSVLRYPMYEKINNIVQNSPWFSDLVNQSVITGRPLDSLLWEDAFYQYLEQDPYDFMVEYGLERQVEIIRDDTAWYAYIQRKAEEKGKPVELVLQEDADFMFAKDYPNTHALHHKLKLIERDLSLYPDLQLLADSLSTVYAQPVDRFLHRLALAGHKKIRMGEIIESIKADASWLQHVKEKAEKNRLTLDAMMQIDAEYVYNQEIETIKAETRSR